MKGIIAGIFLLIMLIIVVLLISGLIWVFTGIYGVESHLGLAGPREVALNVLFKQTTLESTLLSFLELEYQGIPMKKILNAVVIQCKTDVWVENEFINAEEAAKHYFEDPVEGMLKSKRYLLKIRNPEIIIAKSEDLPRSLQKVSTKLFLLNGDDVDLELYVD